MHIIVDLTGEAEFHLCTDEPNVSGLLWAKPFPTNHTRVASQLISFIQRRISYPSRPWTTTIVEVSAFPAFYQSSEAYLGHRPVSNLFTMAWKHSTPLPTIRHIFYVAHQSADALAHLSRFSNYSNKVGNTQLMFHGTTRSRGCTLRLPPASSSTASSLADVVGASGGKFELCVRGDCNLCSIIRGSYDIEKAKSGVSFVRGLLKP